ncbi:hypothetical protein [Holospora obtusa]|uniref:hypothetical protein n=1 Tax=Holospora obtusa TaxID=49893 RepID=UPI0012EC5048|nr:hypothetical protein [Holospora obtusa]
MSPSFLRASETIEYTEESDSSEEKEPKEPNETKSDLNQNAKNLIRQLFLSQFRKVVDGDLARKSLKKSVHSYIEAIQKQALKKIRRSIKGSKSVSSSPRASEERFFGERTFPKENLASLQPEETPVKLVSNVVESQGPLKIDQETQTPLNQETQTQPDPQQVPTLSQDGESSSASEQKEIVAQTQGNVDSQNGADQGAFLPPVSQIPDQSKDIEASPTVVESEYISKHLADHLNREIEEVLKNDPSIKFSKDYQTMLEDHLKGNYFSNTPNVKGARKIRNLIKSFPSLLKITTRAQRKKLGQTKDQKDLLSVEHRQLLSELLEVIKEKDSSNKNVAQTPDQANTPGVSPLFAPVINLTTSVLTNQKNGIIDKAVDEARKNRNNKTSTPH